MCQNPNSADDLRSVVSCLLEISSESEIPTADYSAVLRAAPSGNFKQRRRSPGFAKILARLREIFDGRFVERVAFVEISSARNIPTVDSKALRESFFLREIANARRSSVRDRSESHSRWNSSTSGRIAKRAWPFARRRRRDETLEKSRHFHPCGIEGLCCIGERRTHVARCSRASCYFRLVRRAA